MMILHVKNGMYSFLLWFCAAGLGTLAGNFLIGEAGSEQQRLWRKALSWLLVFVALYLGNKTQGENVASLMCWGAAMALGVSALERKEMKCH